jgi:hypothetical protein
MKTILCLCLICLLSSSTYSQWQFDTTLPYGSHTPTIWQVCVIDSSVSWAFGTMHVNQNYDAPYIARRNSIGWMQVINDLSDTIQAYSIAATDSLNIWLTTYFPQDIFYSSNGGINWLLQYHIADIGSIGVDIIFSKKFPNIGYTYLGYVSGGHYAGVRILKTTNSGQNWNSWIFNLPGYASAGPSMCMVDSNYAWFGVDSLPETSIKKIIMTSNGGINWQIIDVGPFWAGPETIQFSDDKNTGVFVAQNNTVSYIYRTTNGGFNWTPVYSMSNYYSETMRWIPGTSNIYGNSEFILVRSTNNGVNWSIMTGGPGTHLKSMDAVRINDETIYALAVTWDLRVYKLLDTARPIGVKPIGTEIPNYFSLSQNYPNPFNPVTTINYELPASGFVKLVIYDILGREIKVLINEKQSIGKYKVEFDGTNFPSGVYFYRLESGDFVSTKKMVLIK